MADIDDDTEIEISNDDEQDKRSNIDSRDMLLNIVQWQQFL